MKEFTAPLETPRLRLRPWKDSDLEPFARLNADPRVMEFFPKTLSREESDALAATIRERFQAWGYGFWAAEMKANGAFIGFIGISHPAFQAPFTPCTEIGWRLDRAYWGQGLATEGARAAASFAFEHLRLPELVSFTVPANLRSRAVMERLGMRRDSAEDFDHPGLPEGHPLRRHVLYRLKSPR
ncbi:GNAT family N-acetyltransferase [bacterium]|nr:MAG: GNAT family N-acetyltransferase [bacterium]